MACLQFPVALVKLKKNFYIIFGTRLVEIPREKNKISQKEIDSVFESICLDLWGEGTAFRVVNRSQTNFSLKEEIKSFSDQIKIYEASCEKNNIDNEIVYNEEGENNMINMGFPFVYCFEEKRLYEDLYFVMTADMFEQKMMPHLNKAFPLGITSFNVLNKESVAKKISEIVCYKL